MKISDLMVNFLNSSNATLCFHGKERIKADVQDDWSRGKWLRWNLLRNLLRYVFSNIKSFKFQKFVMHFKINSICRRIFARNLAKLRGQNKYRGSGVSGIPSTFRKLLKSNGILYQCIEKEFIYNTFITQNKEFRNKMNDMMAIFTKW